MRIEPTIAATEDIREAIDRNYKAYSEIEKESNVPTTAPPVKKKQKDSAKATKKAAKEAMNKAKGISTPAEEIAETPTKVSEEATSEAIEVADAVSESLEEMPSREVEIKTEQLLTDREVTAQELPAVSDLPQDTSPINLNTYQIQPEALQLIPEVVAREYNVIPLTVANHTLRVAMADVNDVLILEALAARTRMRIEPVKAVAEDIRAAVDYNYKAYSEIGKQFSTAPSPPLPTDEATSDESIADAPAVRALDLIISEAIKDRASDIHIEPEEDRLRLRYRIDGVLHERIALPMSARAPLISRLKIMANMSIADHRPQDGQLSFKVKGKEVDVRVATIHGTYGEMAVLRILDKSSGTLNLNQLGFLPNNLKQYEQMLKAPFGMILISGPTGSGKTTTLYASLNSLDCVGRKIITIEDPVEYRFQDICQLQVNPRAGLTFASGLRAVMRHDPDVILVGEIRDPETAQIAVQAALTGHLVFASVHANDAVGVLFRLLDLGVEPFIVSSAIIGVVAQRMVRRICPHCKHLTTAPIEGQVAYSNELGEERTEFFYGSGCNSCANTGYLKRIAVFESLNVSDEIRSLMLNSASAAQIRDQAVKEGMMSMRHDAMLKVKEGTTSVNEVLRNVFSINQ